MSWSQICVWYSPLRFHREEISGVPNRPISAVVSQGYVDTISITCVSCSGWSLHDQPTWAHTISESRPAGNLVLENLWPRLMEFVEGASRLKGGAKALDIWRIETKIEANCVDSWNLSTLTPHFWVRKTSNSHRNLVCGLGFQRRPRTQTILHDCLNLF